MQEDPENPFRSWLVLAVSKQEASELALFRSVPVSTRRAQKCGGGTWGSSNFSPSNIRTKYPKLYEREAHIGIDDCINTLQTPCLSRADRDVYSSATCQTHDETLGGHGTMAWSEVSIR